MHQFSVIIPTKDRPAMLVRALRSALDQRGVSMDVIVADDGTGVGVEAAQGLAGEAVTAFRTGAVGQVPTRNIAVGQARGRWIAFLDDDDWWASETYLAKLAEALQAGAGLAYASGRIVRQDGGAEEIPFAAQADAVSLRRDNTLLVSGIAYARDLHANLGPFDETLPVYWDWDWYLRVAAAGLRFVAAPGDDVRITTHGDNVTAPANAALRQAELARLCAKHGLVGVVLKNHEGIAIEQREARAQVPFNGRATAS